MNKPREISEENWALIAGCFQFEPQERPTFSDILDELTTAAMATGDYDIYESTSV